MIKLNTRVSKLHYKLLQECRGHGKKEILWKKRYIRFSLFRNRFLCLLKLMLLLRSRIVSRNPRIAYGTI